MSLRPTKTIPSTECDQTQNGNQSASSALNTMCNKMSSHIDQAKHLRPRSSAQACRRIMLSCQELALSLPA